MHTKGVPCPFSLQQIRNGSKYYCWKLRRQGPFIQYQKNRLCTCAIYWRCWRKECRANLQTNVFDLDDRNPNTNGNIINIIWYCGYMFQSSASHWRPDSVKFLNCFTIPTSLSIIPRNMVNRGGKVFLYNRFKYQKNRLRTRAIYWRCWRKECSANLQTKVFDLDDRNPNTVFKSYKKVARDTFIYHFFMGIFNWPQNVNFKKLASQ
jgi:hypothetical protein